jgi:hypothetical protein
MRAEMPVSFHELPIFYHRRALLCSESDHRDSIKALIGMS